MMNARIVLTPIRCLALLLLSAVLCVCLPAGIGSTIADSEAGRPPTYGFFSGIPHELAHPGVPLPGVNDWHCRPSPERPRPIVLVHGQGGGQATNWGVYAPLLRAEGYCVFALTYGVLDGPWPVSAVGGLGPIPDSADEFGRFVDRVLMATGADAVDVVGHSRGTYVPVYHLKTAGRTERVRTLIALAPLWRGSETDAPRTGMRPGGDVHSVVWRGGSPYVPGVRHVNLSTRYDELVVPYTSGQVPGRAGEDVTNIVVQDDCPQDFSDHLAIAGSRRTALRVLALLEPDPVVRHQRIRTGVPCTFVPPLTG